MSPSTSKKKRLRTGKIRARVIYLYIQIDDLIFLITGYEKNVQEDLTAEQKKSIRQLVKRIKDELKEQKQ